MQSFNWASIQGFQQEVVAGKIHQLDAQYLHVWQMLPS